MVDRWSVWERCAQRVIHEIPFGGQCEVSKGPVFNGCVVNLCSLCDQLEVNVSWWVACCGPIR